MLRGQHLEALEAIALEGSRHRVERTLDVARDVLGMDIAYFSEFIQGEQVVSGVSGEPETFGLDPGTAIPLEDTYCRRMVTGEIASLVADTHDEPAVSGLPSTADADLRAYIGVPLEFGDGRIYGTLCCASHDPNHDLDESDVRFMRVLARLLADELERSEPRAVVPEYSAGAIARLSLWFAGAPKAAPAARQALRSLEEQVPEDASYVLSLLVTELVTNSVRHAGIGPTCAVGLEVEVGPERIRAVVSDPGPGFDPALAPASDPLDEGGRGLLLVAQLAESWGVERDPGTRVWFELSRPSA